VGGCFICVWSDCLLLGCPLTEEILASKKMWPGFNFKGARVSKSSPWANRGHVTKEVTLLAFKLIHQSHKNLPKVMRRTWTKSTAEDKTEVCALACALRDELVATVPNIEPKLAVQLTLLTMRRKCVFHLEVFD
jgi:hypothetical protein